MTGTPEIQISHEAPPIVRVMANTLRHSLRCAGPSAVSGIRGSFALQSVKDSQAVTIAIGQGGISLTPGVSQDADLVFTMDFDKPADKPAIQGLLRHPLLAAKVGKLLTLPLPDWTESADRFWRLTSDMPFMPAQLTITCPEQSHSVTFGEGDPAFEIIGPSDVLAAMLIGNEVFVDAAMKGKVRCRGSLKNAAGLSGACVAMMLGERDDD